MATQRLMKVLTTPSKIASTLDWKKLSGSVMSLDIHKDRIGIAIASHPSFGEQVQTMESIQLPTSRGQNISEEMVQKLANIVQQHKVCGVVVSWPLQRDTGRMGAACGRVLHTLDNLLASNSSNGVVTKNRPICLWDGVHPEPEHHDGWGRCASYSRTTDKKIHKASEEQYSQDDNLVAAQIWNDFCKAHWPELFQQQQATTTVAPTKTNATSSMDDWVDAFDYEDSSAFVNSATL